jgi:acrylyl-CoA reductase (NADPH)
MTKGASGAFRAIVVRDADPHPVANVEDAETRSLDAGELLLDVEYSSVNYKDAIALSGRPGVLRSRPMTPGIDAVGTVSVSTHESFVEGEHVILTGAGLGERLDGGLAQRVVAPGESAVRLPDGWGPRDAAAVGTAGFTAALAVLALRRDVAAEAGDVLVTGAAGGVGSFAIALLSRLGYRVTASTGRPDEQASRLRELGAAAIIDRRELAEHSGRPLQTARWSGAVDSVGSATLVGVLAQTGYGGVVAACGLAGGADLPGTVMPFILRAVSLVGINSVEATSARRREAWELIAAELDREVVDAIAPRTVALAEAIPLASEVLAGSVAGRVVVDVNA